MTQHTNSQQNPSWNYGNRQNNNRYQQQGNRFQYSRKDSLERDLRYLERDLVTLDIQIDALGDKGRALESAKNAHMGAIPFAIAQVALSTLGVKFLPPVARTWHYKYHQYLRMEENLKQYAITLFTKRNALTAQIEQIETQIEMLQFHP
jgi:hypothetical protein